MKSINRLVFCGLVFVSATSCTGDPEYLPSGLTPYAPEDCKPVVEQEIDRLDIDRNKITGTDYLTSYLSDGEVGNDYNYQAWMRFNSCTGHYVVDMNKACQIERSYAMGNCRLEDIIASK
jgi:hypothetical protein|tara:strand:+ start:1059 stop:1418 length:360 start_codon:yes stop_codon:yes gene_type:complete